jgi:hypothetical protein
VIEDSHFCIHGISLKNEQYSENNQVNIFTPLSKLPESFSPFGGLSSID